MGNSEADDFEGLIDFLVRELAINDWNKGNTPTALRVRSSALLEGHVHFLSQAFMRDGMDTYLYDTPLAEYTLNGFLGRAQIMWLVGLMGAVAPDTIS